MGHSYCHNVLLKVIGINVTPAYISNEFSIIKHGPAICVHERVDK